VNFRHLDREGLLSDWEWLIGQDKVPILLSAAGDAFIQDTRDGTVHMLDVGVAKTGPVANSAQEFQGLLADPEFVAEYFSIRLIGEIHRRGICLGTGEIYSFKVPPFLGGEQSADNIEPASIEVHFSIFGQAAQQAAALPADTRMNFSIADPKPDKKWWKFW
jgi:hypothetical protein